MCIALLTTAHPDYPFILLNNRDVNMPNTTLAMFCRLTLSWLGILDSSDCESRFLAFS